MEVKLKRVGSEEHDVLQNIMQFYLYEFSQFLSSMELENDGRFKQYNLDAYWSDPSKAAYFIKVNEELAGFVLLSVNAEDGNTIEEFFVMKKYHGKGVGKSAALQVFDKYRGQWEITQIENNYPAQAFWRSILKSYTSDSFTEMYDSKHRSIQTFSNTE